LLVAKLKIPNDDNLTEGLLESVDMESYRPIKEGTNEIKLADDKGTIDPIPVKLGGGAKDSEFDTLENIIKTFNQRFGDIDWSDKDKVHKILTEQLPAEMQADTEIINAIKYSDRQNAKITSDNKIKDLIGQYLFTQTEIYKKFTQDADFQRRYKEFVFDALWQKNR
jgi:type I restriction enzyme R subunit